jgi:murein DD-endopeptidase MepM/ murein hydrolase activator NlpD
MGYAISGKEDLYHQAAWFASTVMDGYYGWREGRRLVVNFQDGQVLRLAPQLNAGSVGLMNVFSVLYDYATWAQLLYGEDSFLKFHENMFGSPWIRAQSVEPLIPVDTLQPEMILPFEPGRIWAFTGGPHAAWSKADVWAALDFAPPSSVGGCHESDEWVVASMPGLVVRSGDGVVVIDMDGDGYEQTGWTLLYLHVSTRDRIPLGAWVEVGDRIGHPSCEGGRSTGTHVHLARRYNGEWVPADGPLPFTLSGYEARAGTQAYQGWLIKDTEIIYANTASTYETHITRED